MLERLDHALDVLTSGPRDAPERHQTLRATIDWSHSLLTEPEQRLFRRMAVFAGGCTVADVEAVCADPGESCLDDLESLVDKALVQVDGQGSRLRMLQTIGEYARERLERRRRGDGVALRHARRYAALAREIRDGIEGTDRSAPSSAVSPRKEPPGCARHASGGGEERRRRRIEVGMQLCGDLYMYWHIRGKNLTAREYANCFSPRTPLPLRRGRAGAQITAGLASWVLGQFERSNDELRDGARIAEQLEAERELCCGAFMAALGLLGFDLDAGLRWANESIERSQAAGFTWGEGSR